MPPTAADSAGPLLALGMVIAPFASERREQVRSTMLQYAPVLSKRVAFRFVVGSSMPTLEAKHGRKRALELRKGLREEMARHGDTVEVDALDGPDIAVACVCGEKQSEWVRYALRTWPSVAFIGKTEDDTYVQLGTLEAELRTLLGRPNLIYGYMTLAVTPTRPTAHVETQPGAACVTQAQHCRKAVWAASKAGARGARGGLRTTGCFLGDLESKDRVPGGSEEVPSVYETETVRRRPLKMVEWWRGANENCGMAAEPNGAERSVIAPFPTGPLAVFGRDLARLLFVECEYSRGYEREARVWNRKTLCSSRDENSHRSLARFALW